MYDAEKRSSLIEKIVEVFFIKFDPQRKLMKVDGRVFNFSRSAKIKPESSCRSNLKKNFWKLRFCISWSKIIWPTHIWPTHIWLTHIWLTHIWPTHIWPTHIWPTLIWSLHIWPNTFGQHSFGQHTFG